MVPIDTLPKGLQVVANINPATHIVSAIKDLLSGSVVFTQEIFLSLIIVIAVVAIFAPLTLKVYMEKV